ncbi:MAG TPA: hypothetical protein DDX19_24425 [Rhodopirellula baltica]|uniref:Uncharacterized protein n=1 Tax=Rhodopirellula baltica SH28 TaxID=993517 RepID=K5DBX0_RHOBT|nr:hypothetical protein RBSH_04667 [Rhodopirellula baltica SH28]HBE65839.1 hypothetical protein [Rhodopirellula baltica]
MTVVTGGRADDHQLHSEKAHPTVQIAILRVAAQTRCQPHWTLGQNSETARSAQSRNQLW